MPLGKRKGKGHCLGGAFTGGAFTGGACSLGYCNLHVANTGFLTYRVVAFRPEVLLGSVMPTQIPPQLNMGVLPCEMAPELTQR